MCKIGDDVRVHKLQTTMMEQGILLDTGAVLALFSHYVNTGKIGVATNLIRKPPPGVTYSDRDAFDMLETVTHHVTPMDCVAFFEILCKLGLPLSPVARNLILEHCVKLHEWSACEHMLAFLLAHVPGVPNAVFIFALRAFARSKQEQLVIRVLQLMREHNRSAGARSYAAILDALNGREHAAMVTALKTDMREKRIRPNKEVCEVMIGLANSATYYQDVIYWYRTMKSKNLKRSPVTHRMVVEAYAHLGMVDKELFEAMEEAPYGLVSAFHHYRVYKNTPVMALTFRAICKHQLIPVPSVVNYAMPVVVEFAQKELTGEPRCSDWMEEHLGEGWPEFLVETLNLCKKDKIELWIHVHARVQEYVTWRTNFKPNNNINNINNTNNNDINNTNNNNVNNSHTNSIEGADESQRRVHEAGREGNSKANSIEDGRGEMDTRRGERESERSERESEKVERESKREGVSIRQRSKPERGGYKDHVLVAN
jgi:hypothetical protein